MTSVRKKDLEHGQEHGEIQNLGSPILSKIQQAFLYIRTIASGTAHEEFSSCRSVEGNRCGAVHVAWNKEEAKLVLFVKILDFDMMGLLRKGKLATPSWLSHLASSAQVEVNCLSFLDSVLSPEDGSLGLKAVIDDMTGNVAPRRVVCVGFCIGGSVATLAAPWVAVQWPTADVRCISFGASAVGNAAFTAAFKWLVGISYRVTFRRDPVPAQSAVPNTLKHVHGAIYICGDGMRPGIQPDHNLGKTDKGDIRDHTPSAYLGALNTNCERQAAREKAAGGACRAKLAQCSFKCPVERCRQRRAARAASSAASRSGDLAVSSDSPTAAGSPTAEPPIDESVLEGPRLSMRDSVSSISDSQDGDMGVIGQQPTGLTAYVKAGMGSLIADTATVSKAALASAASALLRRPASSSSQPSQRAPDPPTGAHQDFDLVYMGPAKFAEIRALKKDWPGYIPADSCTAPVNGQDNLISTNTDTNTSSMCNPASPMACNQSGQVTASGCRSAAGADAMTPSFCSGLVPAGMFSHTVVTSHGTVVPTHEAARSILESVFIQKGLASPGSPVFTKSLPQLLGMVPAPAEALQAAKIASGVTSVQGDVHAGGSTAGLAAEQELAHSNAEPSIAGTAGSDAEQDAPVLAHLNVQPSPAGTAGGEPEEQWAGTQSPAQVAATAVAAAAENEAAAELPPVGSSKQPEEGSDGSDAEARRTSIDADESSAQEYARKLTRTFSLQESDSSGVDQRELSNLQKVLVIGKISQAAILAAAAYRNHDTFKRQTGITNCRLIYDKEHHDTKVHVGWLEGGTAVFAFRGTASRQDGLQDVKIFSRNIDYLQELYPGVKAHLGFLQQFAAVCHPDRSETNMAAVLKDLSGGQTPNRVICCGHSLGGALATLGAAWAALEYPDADIRCITFGSPRVANKVFGKAFHALVGTSLRLVHGFDPIPSLPPSLMYKHVPGVIHIKRDDLLLKHRPWHTMLRSSVGDHSMMKYSSGIYKHMPGGLESLPSFFAPKPVTKLCETICKASYKRGRVSSQQTDTDASLHSKQGSSPKNSNEAPDHVWAGSFLACWGSNDLDQQPTAAKAASISGIEANDSASSQLMA